MNLHFVQHEADLCGSSRTLSEAAPPLPLLHAMASSDLIRRFVRRWRDLLSRRVGRSEDEARDVTLHGIHSRDSAGNDIHYLIAKRRKPD